MKKDEIYRHIRQEIISGVWKAGDKLPTEMESMELYHVSRDTVRGAFKKLEEAGYLERVKAKGTFVCLPDTQPEDQTIYLLVPCEEYLRRTVVHFQRLMAELITEAAFVGWRISPVIFSKTNSNKDIWWENLAFFNANSRIVVNRLWFAPYFKTLLSLNSRVAFIINDAVLPEEYSSITSNWQNFVEQDSVVAEKTVTYLRSLGCRKIAVAMPNIDDPLNSFADGCRMAMNRSGLTGEFINISNDGFPSGITTAMQKKTFDGIITHLDETALNKRLSFRENLGIPEEMPVVAIPLKDDACYMERPERIPIIDYPLRTMARDIIAHLTDIQYIPGQYNFEPSVLGAEKEVEVFA